MGKRLCGLYGWCTIYAWVKIWLSEKSKRSSSPIKGNPLRDSPLCPCQLDSSETLNSIIKIVNCIKSGALNTRLFKELRKDMDSDHEVLFVYTAVRWLSKGNVNCVFELKDEIKLFLEVQGKQDLLVYFNDKEWLERLAYLADIFEQQNRLNLKLQGK